MLHPNVFQNYSLLGIGYNAVIEDCDTVLLLCAQNAITKFANFIEIFFSFFLEFRNHWVMILSILGF